MAAIWLGCSHRKSCQPWYNEGIWDVFRRLRKRLQVRIASVKNIVEDGSAAKHRTRGQSRFCSMSIEMSNCVGT